MTFLLLIRYLKIQNVPNTLDSFLKFETTVSAARRFRTGRLVELDLLSVELFVIK
jgi:hypothetical protein